MKVLIITASSDLISTKYLDMAENISSFLANENCDLIFGASTKSMMGACYNTFKKNNRNIYSYTTPKYKDEFTALSKAKHYLVATTFDLKKDMFNEADIIICLPGGIGTYSEILSFLEEKRSNSKQKPIIIYNEYGFYDKLLSILTDLVNDKFSDKSIYDNFIIVNNQEEFEKVILNIRRIIK